MNGVRRLSALVFLKYLLVIKTFPVLGLKLIYATLFYGSCHINIYSRWIIYKVKLLYYSRREVCFQWRLSGQKIVSHIIISKADEEIFILNSVVNV